MTALPPISNRRVVGLKDGQIKLLRKLLLNPVCSHPECSEKTDDAHHIFPRSTITNDSWYVEITEDDDSKKILPHVTGLCRKHHRDVEEHMSWIKYEDGQFIWYDRAGAEQEQGWLSNPDYRPLDPIDAMWGESGPLIPQPGEVQHPKKKQAREKKAPAGTAQKNLSAPAEEMEAFLVLAEEARRMLERPESRRWLFYTLLETLTIFVRDAS